MVNVYGSLICSYAYIYILSAFTAKPYGKPSECNVVFISVTTSVHEMLGDVKIKHVPTNLIGHR